MDLFSSNDNNSLFNDHISAPVTTNGISANGTNKRNGIVTNGFSLSVKNAKDVIAKNGFHLPPPASKADKNNLFTPDTDFVADFGSANIFDALNKPSINNNNSSSSSILSIGHSNGHHTNGVESINGNQINGNTTTDLNKNAGENFADFEHNTIYNAAGEFQLTS